MAERAPIMDYGGLEIQTNSGKQEINIQTDPCHTRTTSKSVHMGMPLTAQFLAPVKVHLSAL